MSVLSGLAASAAVFMGALDFIGAMTWTTKRDFAKADSAETRATLWFILAAVILK